MDDVLAIKDWDDLKRFFPNNGNGSRIILTTRLSDVATCLGSLNPYPLTFLDEDNSWDLFCQSTFAQIGCPYAELERIGKDIVKSCRGLPLEIVVIGRLLANSNMSQEYWEFVAKNISSFGNLVDSEHCLKELSLSYKSLPMHLKPCFLYMRVVREDDFIYMSSLIDCWIAKGFIKPRSDKSLEEIADKYIKDLVDRNLIFIKDMVECCIHDLLRNLCIREANNELFIPSPKMQYAMPDSEEDSCFLCYKLITYKEGMRLSRLVHIFASPSQVSPFVCDTCKVKYSHIRRPRLVMTMSDCFCEEIMHPTEVCYASIFLWDDAIQFVSPSQIYLLWNLQTLEINSGLVVLPVEIWEMPHLRHIKVEQGAYLPDPIGNHTDGEDFPVLNNLQTLDRVQNFKCTKEILDRIPNLKDLNISYESEPKVGMKLLDYSLHNLVQLRKLESLVVAGALEKITFPRSLKELILVDYRILWEDMSNLGSLHNLERLVLQRGIEGTEWNPVEGEFLRLKELVIHSADLVCWRADQIHFPVLEQLKLTYLELLEEIPSGIGDISALQSIEVYNCNESINNSANQILEEQQSIGNESLRLSVTNYKDSPPRKDLTSDKGSTLEEDYALIRQFCRALS